MMWKIEKLPAVSCHKRGQHSVGRGGSELSWDSERLRSFHLLGSQRVFLLYTCVYAASVSMSIYVPSSRSRTQYKYTDNLFANTEIEVFQSQLPHVLPLFIWSADKLKLAKAVAGNCWHVFCNFHGIVTPFNWSLTGLTSRLQVQDLLTSNQVMGTFNVYIIHLLKCV